MSEQLLLLSCWLPLRMLKHCTGVTPEDAVPCTGVQLEEEIGGQSRRGCSVCCIPPSAKAPAAASAKGSPTFPPCCTKLEQQTQICFASVPQPVPLTASPEICQAPCESPSRGQLWLSRGAEQAGSLPTSLRMGLIPAQLLPRAAADALAQGACVSEISAPQQPCGD